MYIRVVHYRERLGTATLKARRIPGLRRISPWTVRNRLLERGIRPRRPAIPHVLQQRHRVVRFAWCRRHIHFTQQDWARAFSGMNPGFITRVYRCVGERFHDSCVIQRLPFGGGGVMVWDGILSRDRTALVVVDGTLTGIRYCDEIKRPMLFHLFSNITPRCNKITLAHMSRGSSTTSFRKNVNVLLWLAMSPDLRP